MEPLERRTLLAAGPAITEFMAVNDSTLADEDGDYSDWIEIYNPDAAPLDLDGWSLSDDAADLDKWNFPAVTVEPGGYLLVFASGKDRRDAAAPLHTGFRLSGDGEFLALADPAGTVVSAFDPAFPKQRGGFSFGSAIDVAFETLIGSAAAVDVRVPTDDALGDTWTQPDFDAAGWTHGPTPVGYDVGRADPPADPARTHIDIGSAFNADTIATSTGDSAGTGFRDAWNEKFLRDPGFSADGLVQLAGTSFQLGPYDADNSVLFDSGASTTIDVADAAYSQISVLHTAVGFNVGYGAQDGTVTIYYTDGTSQVDAWDVADNDGNNSQGSSLGALTGLTLWRFGGTGGNWGGRRLWYQSFPVDENKTVDRLDFSTSGVTDPDADFAIYALTGIAAGASGTPAAESFPIAMPAAALNGDTLATSTADSAGAGYRANNEKFLMDVFPADGVLEVPGGPTFQLEPYTQDNTVLLGLGEAATLDVADGRYDKLSILHTAVGFNTSETDGTVTVRYTDGSSESLLWDVADNDGNNSRGLSLDALNGLTLYGFNTGTTNLGRQLWYQTFDVDPAKTVDAISLSTVGVVDGGGTDAVFGVYAVTGMRYFSFADVIGTDVQADMLGNNTSAYVRIPFTVDDPNAFNRLTLDVRYDDGFAAYLNGTEVVRRNAPEGPLAYDAAAAGERGLAEAVAFEAVNLTGSLGLLESGLNVLAIHGLNVTVDDDDFFIEPRLTAADVTVLPGLAYFEQPTPGELNTGGFLGFVADTKFSADRGFYDAPFELSITTAMPEAAIYLTTDGSEPSPEGGIPYAGPITVSNTTTLRAAAFRDGYRPSDVDTQTYIFIADVLAQPATRDGYAQPMMQSRGGGTPPVQLDFEVDPRIAFDPAYQDDFIAGLTAIPAISIVMDVDDLLGPNGFYDKGGSANNGLYERPASVEIIDPAHPDENVQANAGIRPHSHPLVKRSLQLLFKKEYGPGKLVTSLFQNAPVGGDDASESIDRLVLRAGHNRSFVHYWNPDDSSYTRDEWARVTRRAMSGTGAAAHGTFVHLFINGMYWGLYNPLERPDAAFSAEYFGGDNGDWYARNHGNYGSGGETISGDSTRFDYLVGVLAEKDLSIAENYAEFGQYLDVEQFADYVMLNFFGGNADWPHNNFYGGNRNGDDPTPFVYYDWDAEGFLDGRDASGPFNPPGGRGNAGSWVHPNFVAGATPASDVARLWNAARQSPEFMMMFADRVHRNTANGGALADARSQQRWLTLNGSIEDAIIGESARWGDVREPFDGVVRTRDGVWQADVDRVRDMLDGNAGRLIEALRAEGFYPAADPPAFSQHGGVVPPGYLLDVTGDWSGAGTVQLYYTTDGTDPRASGGALGATAIEYAGPTAINVSQTVKARAKVDGLWSALTEAVFVVNPAAAGNLAVSEVHYNPLPATQAEVAALPSVNGDDFEFIELMNVSDAPISLSNVSFAPGEPVAFAFDPAGAPMLGAGRTALIVSDPAAFELRFGPTAAANIAGQFDSGRIRDEGERITLLDADGQIIHSFRYNDRAPWPAGADGSGASMQLIAPETNPDHADPNSWVAAPVTPGDVLPATVVSRTFVYGGSALDDGANGAVAGDKTALLPGEIATAANFSSFDRGINTLVIDVSALAGPTLVGAGDFTFRIGNDDDPAAWPAAPTPNVTVLEGAGRGGADRIVLTWEDGEVTNTWLEATLHGGVDHASATGLATDDVFYFGNAIGETGNDAGNALVNAADVIAIRDNPRGSLNPASIGDPYDVNRDSFVNAVDMILARDNAAGPLTALRWITPVATPAAHGESGKRKAESGGSRTIAAAKLRRDVGWLGLNHEERVVNPQRRVTGGGKAQRCPSAVRLEDIGTSLVAWDPIPPDWLDSGT